MKFCGARQHTFGKKSKKISAKAIAIGVICKFSVIGMNGSEHTNTVCVVQQSYVNVGEELQ